VVTGDRTQIDLPPNRRSGLVEATQALRDVAGIAFCGFDERDVVRHELVQSVIRAYRQHRYGDGSADAKGGGRGERSAF
jgi:phosphate starvation-inducible PhoH-like protein